MKTETQLNAEIKRLQKAVEKQALELVSKNRELEIEAALEKVRSASMAMHKSDELRKVVEMLFLQFSELDLDFYQVWINIFRLEEGVSDCWFSPVKEVINEAYTAVVPLKPFENLSIKSWRAGEEFSYLSWKGLKEVDKVMKELSMMTNHPSFHQVQQKKRMKRVEIVDCNHKYGVIAMAKNEDITEEDRSILKRFTKAFEQAYTRFLDLQKAEAQARESQIEAALEKVRSASMAMHKSDDLLLVIKAVHEQITELGIKVDASNFQIYIENSRDFYLWAITTTHSYQQKLRITYIDFGMTKKMWDAWEKGESFVELQSDADEMYRWWNKAFEVSDLRHTPQHRREIILSAPGWNSIVARRKTVGLQLHRYNLESFTEQEKDFLERLATVFEQSYTRFLDLQKAEAQARESQIEAALERVRSRTMGMQKSQELCETATVLFQQLFALGIKPGACAFSILNDKDQTGEVWISSDGNVYDNSFIHPYHTDPAQERIFEAWKAGKTFHLDDLENEELTNHLQFLSKHMPIFDMLESANDDLPKRIVIHAIYFSQGFIGLTYESPQLEHIPTFIRFAKVFEQTYTRFLDLQKAEAQAREAQIEAALERVRSRSMAMHNSEELNEVATELFQQIRQLGGNLWTCGIVLCQKDSEVDHFMVALENGMAPTIEIPNTKDPSTKNMYYNWKNGADYYVEEAGGKDLKKHYDYLETLPTMKPVIENLKASGISLPTWQKWHAAYFTHGYLMIITLEPYPQEEVFKRFAKVFEQTYIRFLDLKKAEAQARESQIEAALERIRSASMAMHKSEELPQVALTFLIQIEELAIPVLGVALSETNTETNTCVTYFADNTAEGQNRELSISKEFEINEFWLAEESITQMKSGKKEFTITAEGQRLELWIKWIENIFSKKRAERLRSANLDKVYFHTFQFHEYSGILFSSLTPLPEEYRPVIQRLVSTFRLSYLRFLDLQKAEAQTREAEIEAGLERVRSASMAMHRSEELEKVVEVTFRQLQNLRLPIDGCQLITFEDQSKDFHFWSATPDMIYPTRLNIPYFDHPVFSKFWEARDRGASFTSFDLTRQETLDFYNHLYDKTNLGIAVTKERWGKIQSIEHGFKTSWGIQKNTGLWVFNFTNHQFTEEENLLIDRFAKVFEQTYTRFLDLQKAEAQAREAEIEASLERVRSKTMAMHSSQDVGNTMALLFDELKDLGIEANRSGVLIMRANQTSEIWTARAKPGDQVELYSWKLDMSLNQMTREVYDGWKNQTNLINYLFEGEDRINYYQTLNESPDIPVQFNNIKLSEREFGTACYFHEGGIYIFSPKMISKDHANILARFASGFGQTYRRYLDLVLAETRTREAQIEAALERVRAKAMAMHNTNDLAEANNVVFDELNLLGISPLRSGIGLIDKETRQGQMFATVPAERGKTLLLIGDISLTNSPILESIFEFWSKKQLYHVELNGQELKEYYDLLLSSYDDLPRPKFSKKEIQHGYFLPFTHGSFYAWAQEPFNDEELKTIERFVGVINLTYNRYFDLQKAEAQAREATKQASLDRVRAEIASMRDAKDLERITPVIWSELKSLGVPFFRCGVMLVNEEEEKLDFYLSNPEGEALAALHLDYDNSELTQKGVSHWRNKETYIEHWDQKQFLTFMKSLMDQGQVSDAATYQGGERPPTRLTLQFVPFAQGMVYVGTETDLSEEELDLVKALGNSLSVAYARYEDFTRLDIAKAKAEKALKDLEAAQEQLVQQEKLASLGQLTAGIAHEIKNPLNFVNNFSDLSRELIEEVFEELENLEDSDAKEEIVAILNDVKANLSKVHEHGTRADSIVSSMLQHSRASGSKREPKPFNPLVKEFVNLSFHGMRAGKSPINVDIDLQLDPKIGEVTLISEDFSRVILNLCNNAFDAMRDKLKSGESADYLAKLTVKTSLENGKVILSIQDNGSGIPKEIQDKILQPFFTTKKGTEGTGLGLSITHDIVKAHGGELKVETKEGEGSEFSIQLPLV